MSPWNAKQMTLLCMLWTNINLDVLIWVRCLFVKEKLRGACTDLPENLCTAFFRTGDHSQGIRFLVLLWNIDFFLHNFIERGRVTRTRDNNFFATKTSARSTKTWPITIFLHQNIHERHENLAANSGRPWMIDARTLHYSYCKLFIYHSTYTILQRTPTILLHRTNCTQQRNATYRLYSFGNIISFHHICVCLCYWQYSISIMYCLGQSFVLPNPHRGLTASRGLFASYSKCCILIREIEF